MEEVQQELSGLLGPSGLRGQVERLGLGGSTDSSVESSEGDGFSVLDNVLEVLLGTLEGVTLQLTGSLVGVL